MNTSRTTDTTIGIEDGFIIELDKKNPKVKPAPWKRSTGPEWEE